MMTPTGGGATSPSCARAAPPPQAGASWDQGQGGDGGSLPAAGRVASPGVQVLERLSVPHRDQRPAGAILPTGEIAALRVGVEVAQDRRPDPQSPQLQQALDWEASPDRARPPSGVRFSRRR